jgi:hypothetical protein
MTTQCACGHGRQDHHIKAFHCWRCPRRSPCLVFRAAPWPPPRPAADGRSPVRDIGDWAVLLAALLAVAVLVVRLVGG